ncbi:DUF305 domain-containing protein [Cyanobium sp. WAJ14-Wanaka]|uniref:DUF305 domain-containing protein n=1 Tax=Cyanobium sp. WAJ14-Wanaka TaxID=2823725 RepID=UPI0020CEFF7E|nr:DUF305 domain-containing protein [Cyanobium sp. WAJ14-Wanaka]MCP9775372.1 DUF305 domain-containing protein [Cyanobium sp. WAJ14-Wanaka]
MRRALTFLILINLLAATAKTPTARAQVNQHDHHQMTGSPATDSPPLDQSSAHSHDVGPSGSTYDLRWIDAMVQHHTGALRMAEFVFNVGSPGVGAMANSIWRDQAREIKSMGQWRKAWYPEAPVFSVVLRPNGNPNEINALIPMGAAQIQAMQLMGSTPTRENRVNWFLEGMIAHHGGALLMAHDALRKSSNNTIRRLAQQIIVAQRQEILELRRMLKHDGLDKPNYYQFDALFTF